jgi:hypothetical protein
VLFFGVDRGRLVTGTFHAADELRPGEAGD